MAVIISLGEVVNTTTDVTSWSPWQSYPVRMDVEMYGRRNRTYSDLYRAQPNVRTCVDFIARNIAQLGLQVFRRVSDTDRVRVTDHPFAKLLDMPLPSSMKITKYRNIEAVVSDMCIYFNAYWLKIRVAGSVTGLLRVPPTAVVVEGGLAPKRYMLTLSTGPKEIAPEDIVHFRGYNPENPLMGLSPLETLRRILAEEDASGRYREELWENGARMRGFIKRPATAPEWSDTARGRFIADFNQAYAGSGKGGLTAVLEEGMEWQEAAFNPQEAEYIQGRKLTREECARAYHIPLPMVGILDNATFSNIKEQHQNLYQDSLGPWLEMIQQDLELQLMPDFPDVTDMYAEFNLMEKLKGDFEDQVKTLQSAVGRPWMTADEARARMNLPSMGGDADELVTPLNVVVGGQASPQDSTPDTLPPAPGETPKELKGKGINPLSRQLRDIHQKRFVSLLVRHYKRQETAIIGRVPKALKEDIGGIWWDSDRWNKELMTDLYRANSATAMDWATRMVDMGIEIEDMTVFEARMQAWLVDHSTAQSTYINERTKDAVSGALLEEDPAQSVRDVFKMAVETWAVSEAVSMVTSILNFGTHEAALAGRLQTKTWRTTSKDPRDSHAAIDGETVGIRDTFSNGLRWPGDPNGKAADNANCQCVVEFG